MPEYHSVISGTDSIDREFGQVYDIHFADGYVYFVSSKKLFRWSANTLKIWSPYTSGSIFYRSFWINHQLYVWQSNFGLMLLEDGVLKVAPGGETFVTNYVTFMKDGWEVQGHDAILVGSLREGLFTYDGGSFTPYPAEADELFKTGMLFKGLALNNGNIAFATLSNGVIIMDKNGHTVTALDKKAGLYDDIVLDLYEDNLSGLWAGLQTGVSRVELNSPISYFDKELGINSVTNTIASFDGKTYIGTSLGISVHDGLGLTPFRNIGRERFTCWDLQEVEGQLWAATHTGVYVIAGNNMERLTPEVSARVIYQWRHDPKVVFIGVGNGLTYMINEGGKWRYKGKIGAFASEVRSIAEADDGSVYCGYADVFGIDFSLGRIDSPAISQAFSYADVSEMNFTDGQLFQYGKQVFFGTNIGLYSLDENTRAFVKDSLIDNRVLKAGRNNSRVGVDDHGGLWMLSDNLMGKLVSDTSGGIAPDTLGFMRIPQTQIWSVDVNDPDYVWYGATKYVYRYAKKDEKKYALNYTALIRKVVAGDSLLYYGSGDADMGMDMGSGGKPDRVALSYDHNSISFSYAIPFYEGGERNVYSYFLDGFDKEWSSWSPETRKEYTNLPEGKYVFKIRGRNLYHQVSNPGQYAFTILTPFYRSMWFYGIQIGLLLMLFGVSYRFGKAGGRLARLAPAIATVAIVVLFEYFQNYVEDNFENLTGGITFLKVLVNVVLVFMLLPLEGMLKRIVGGRREGETMGKQ